LRACFSFSCVVLVVCSFIAAAVGQPVPMTQRGPPFETVKVHTDIELSADGSYLESSEDAYRPLDARGLQAMRQVTLSYTEGFQSLDVMRAYTLKADGQKIDVAQSNILRGYGATTAPGFDDVRTLTIVFPNVEVGDQVVLVTVLKQIQPWFPGQFAAAFSFNRAILARDTEVSLTAPASDIGLSIDAKGLQGGERESFGSKYRWVWHYSNASPITVEPDAVADADEEPHLAISTFAGYDVVARAYAERFKDKSEVTSDIQSLADSVTSGITDKREEARALYEWVSSHIAYVGIVLGAGGFTPHDAAQVLETKYGDCKDHVMLLQALLSAKGIGSSPALIYALPSFVLPTAASPFAFNHLITYIPEFDLFLDSTAQFVSFGALPGNDAGKPVLLVSTGQIDHTPVTTPDNATIHVVRTVKLASDGSLEGDTQVTSTGALAGEMRALMSVLPANAEANFLRQVLGPGSDGSFSRGDPKDLGSAYAFGAHYRMTSIVNFPGPGALPPRLGYSPLTFTTLIAGELPPTRSTAYSCASLEASESTSIELPPGVTIIALPKSATMQTAGVKLVLNFTQSGTNKVLEAIDLRIEHPAQFCTPEYYAQVRGDLAKMASALNAQIVYR
jgi:transglutaminase-like putative cysteine protease